MSDAYPAPVAGTLRFIDWGAIIAGGVIAAGISFTLIAFGSGIGLSIASTSPTWRDSSPWLWLLSGLYLIFVALCSFGFGGYAAGRMRLPRALSEARENAFRDGMHGLAMWGLAILISAVLALLAIQDISRQMAPSGGAAGPASSVAGENILASELDELFRSYHYAPGPNIAYERAEAARILLKSSRHRGIPPDDRAWLSHVVSTRAGVSGQEADARANQIVAESRDEIVRARDAAVMEAFLVCVALLVGAAVAWFAAEEGGRDRELGRVPDWSWALRARRR
jgi:hypothetical protein